MDKLISEIADIIEHVDDADEAARLSLVAVLDGIHGADVTQAAIKRWNRIKAESDPNNWSNDNSGHSAHGRFLEEIIDALKAQITERENG